MNGRFKGGQGRHCLEAPSHLFCTIMWNVYNKETPARRGLGLVAAGLAFAGAIGMAWVLTSVRSARQAAYRDQSPVDWPISFSLPEEYAWLQDSRDPGVETNAEGRSGRARYLGMSPALGRSDVLVWFTEASEGSPAAAGPEGYLPTKRGGSDPIEMGPMTGQLADLRMDDGSPAMIAVGSDPNGLTVVVRFMGETSRAQQEESLRSICTSISLRN